MSKVIKTVLKVAAVVATFFIPGVGALIGKALVTAAVSIGVSRLVAKRASTPADAGGDAGGRIQLPPATTNKLPVIYGSAFVGGAITDAMLSTDQKTMWYVVALAEHSDDQGGGGGNYTYDLTKCYYDGKQIQFGSNGQVTGLITNNATSQLDTRCNGYLYVYLFTNGSNSGYNTGGLTADQILSVANGVPASHAWNGTQTMTNCAFAIVKVIYSTDAGTTGVGGLVTHITNSLTKPGECIKDYMLNTRYGCGLPITSIDEPSLAALDLYSDDPIDYKPVGWSPGDPYSQQARYRINGPLDTGQSCLNNLQFLVDSADSWLQYSELTGKWRVVINKLYDGYPNPAGLFAVDSSNLVGGIEVSPIDLNETYNQIEVAYPNTNIKDQTDYQIIDLFVEDPQLLSENEAINRLNVTLPLVNNAVQAKYLAARRIYQSREDLAIAFKLDFSGIQVEAGDVIRVTHEVYGWTDKLFRVSYVAEEKDTEGNLFAAIQAFEYSDGIYADIIQDYIPAFNTGLKDPNVIDPPGTPTVAENPVATDGTRSFKVSSTVPAEGLVLYMDFNYGNNSNVLEHRLYRTVQQSNGDPFINGTGANIDINDIPNGDYYFSVTGRNNTAGRRSNSSALFTWSGAVVPNVSTNAACNSFSSGNTITSDQVLNITIGSNVAITSGTGNLDANTYVTGIASTGSPTIFTVTPAPLAPLSNACIEVTSGGFSGNVYRPNVTPGNTIVSNTMPGNKIVDYTITSNKMSNTGVTPGCYSSATICIDAAGRIYSAANGTGGGGNVAIQLNGSNVCDASTLNFAGSVAATCANGVATITVSSGGAGGSQTRYGGSISNVWTTSLRSYSSTLNIVGGREFYCNANIGVLSQAWSANLPCDYDPYYNNCATTGTGFLENSTGQFQPLGAAFQEVGFTCSNVYQGDGKYGWVGVLRSSTFSSAVNYNHKFTATIQLVAPADCEVQVCPGIGLNYTANNNIRGVFVDYTTVENIYLYANYPQTVTITYTRNAQNLNYIFTPNTCYIGELVLFVRNLGSGALYVPTGHMLTFPS